MKISCYKCENIGNVLPLLIFSWHLVKKEIAREVETFSRYKLYIRFDRNGKSWSRLEFFTHKYTFLTSDSEWKKSLQIFGLSDRGREGNIFFPKLSLSSHGQFLGRLFCLVLDSKRTQPDKIVLYMACEHFNINPGCKILTWFRFHERIFKYVKALVTPTTD